MHAFPYTRTMKRWFNRLCFERAFITDCIANNSEDVFTVIFRKTIPCREINNIINRFLKMCMNSFRNNQYVQLYFYFYTRHIFWTKVFYKIYFNDNAFRTKYFHSHGRFGKKSNTLSKMSSVQ